MQINDPAKVEEGNRSYALAGRTTAEKEEARHREEMREIKRIVTPFGRKVATKETLRGALDAYQEWIERTFVDVEGRTTQTGKKQGERAARIKRFVKDMPLSDLGTHEIEEIIEFWRTRPWKPATRKRPSDPELGAFQLVILGRFPSRPVVESILKENHVRLYSEGELD